MDALSDPAPFTDAQMDQLARLVGRVVEDKTKALEDNVAKRLQEVQSQSHPKRHRNQNGDPHDSHEEEGELSPDETETYMQSLSGVLDQEEKTGEPLFRENSEHFLKGHR